MRGTKAAAPHPGSLRQPADVPRNVTGNNPPGHFRRLGVSRSEVVSGQDVERNVFVEAPP